MHSGCRKSCESSTFVQHFSEKKRGLAKYMYFGFEPKVQCFPQNINVSLVETQNKFCKSLKNSARISDPEKSISLSKNLSVLFPRSKARSPSIIVKELAIFGI